MKRCAVIGSGIGGLAAALRIRKKGYVVDVFESNDYPGGKLRELRQGGYRFDLGPSVFTMPELVDELFSLYGKDPRNYFRYSKLENSFTCFFPDGTFINSFSKPSDLVDEIVKKTGESEKKVWAYLGDIENKYNITKPVFIENSLHKVKNYFTREVLWGILNFHKVGAFKTMKAGNESFFKDKRLVRWLNYFATFVGSNPLSAPATLNIIPHLVLTKGTYLPEKGMYSLVEALVKLAKEVGIQFHFNHPVSEILLKEGRVEGIRLKSGETHKADRVVSNLDVNNTYYHLLPKEKPPLIYLKQPRSSSIIGFYWGIRGIHAHLNVHNLIFSQHEENEFEAIFKNKTISDDPSIYIGITSRKIPMDAPSGCENWFVIVTAPEMAGQDWDQLVEKARRQVLELTRKRLNINPDIEVEYVLTPPMIQHWYSSPGGSIYGNNSNSKFSAFLRHPNFSNKIKGLYFVGGSVHPGAGIPLCLNSAKIVDKIFC